MFAIWYTILVYMRIHTTPERGENKTMFYYRGQEASGESKIHFRSFSMEQKAWWNGSSFIGILVNIQRLLQKNDGIRHAW